MKRKVAYLDMLQLLFVSSPGGVAAHKAACLQTIIDHVKQEEEAVSAAALSCLSAVADSLQQEIDGVCALLLEMNRAAASSDKIRYVLSPSLSTLPSFYLRTLWLHT